MFLQEISIPDLLLFQIGGIILISIGLYNKLQGAAELQQDLEDERKAGTLDAGSKEIRKIAEKGLHRSLWFDSSLVAILNSLTIFLIHSELAVAVTSSVIPVVCWIYDRKLKGNKKNHKKTKTLLLYLAFSSVPGQMFYYFMLYERQNTPSLNQINDFLSFMIGFSISTSILILASVAVKDYTGRPI
jgi:uncharacterized membrane protein